MPVTVPLTTPVKGIASARAVAESAALAPDDTATGPAIDRILWFLSGLTHEALLRDTEGILDVLHLLGVQRAARATAWLTRTVAANSPDAAAYWSQLHDLNGISATAA